MKLSIIIPMYNAQNIKETLKEYTASLNKLIKDYEIILVNDGSTNNCLKDAKKFKNKKIRIVGYKENRGKGYAIKYGFKFVRGDYVSFLDSGGELDASQICSFMKIMDEENADIVIGSKRHRESKVHYPLMRRIMSRAYQAMNRILFNLEVKDTQVGIKLFRKEVLDEIMPKIAIKRFAFDLELLVLANKFGFMIIEAPIVMKYKFESTINLKAVFWMLWDTAAIFYRLRIMRWYDKI